MALEAGSRLGTFEIVSRLGSGAMGEVYRAKDLKLGRDVALKALSPELAGDAERLRRFEQEARAASALNHPNIVHIYDVGQDGDTHFIVMELVEGKTLRELLRDAPFDEEKILDFARQLAAGLAKAHGIGIVHRDVKPENIMVTPDGFIKILDFGLAKLLEAPFEGHSEMATLARQATRHGTLIGTVEYMSPEQAAGKSVDHRADQFAFGLIVYEMATGRLAFRRETAAQTLAAIIESEPEPLAELNPRCPEGLRRIVRRCLMKVPSARYRNTSELVRDLEAVSMGGFRVPPPPPVPPVPQEPEPGMPSIGRHVRREIYGALRDTTVYLRSRDGRVRALSERRLRRRLRRDRFSGDEMIRREDDDAWQPLYESQIFLQEVPFEGDPDTWLRRRRLLELARHAGLFVTFGTAWYVFQGDVPVWMGFWGIGLVMHGFRTLPVLLRGKRLHAGKAPAASALPDELLSDAFRNEVDEVKALLARRGGPEAPALLEEIDAIVARVRELATKRRDLAQQTSEEERAKLARAMTEAERCLTDARNPGDRKLYERQLDVLRQRRAAIEKALAAIGRLEVRQDVATQQVKQLRLDLARGEALSATTPELTSRLQDIRHEVDARELVDDAIAGELSS